MEIYEVLTISYYDGEENVQSDIFAVELDARDFYRVGVEELVEYAKQFGWEICEGEDIYEIYEEDNYSMRHTSTRINKKLVN